jgi:hypothetical protein
MEGVKANDQGAIKQSTAAELQVTTLYSSTAGRSSVSMA